MEPPNKLILNPLQRSLHDALANKSGALAAMYLGAHHVLLSGGNPERHSQSAQSFRELIQHLWAEYDPSLKKKDMGLKVKAKHLETLWLKIRRRNGQIIVAAQMAPMDMDGFFARLDEFFEWITHFLPNRNQQTSRAIANMDPMLGKMPAAIMSLRVKEFQTLREYFEDVAHHNIRPASDSEFQSYVAALESFLIERLQPRTSQSFADIEKLIKEGETDA
jgi:hypothetical protein